MPTGDIPVYRRVQDRSRARPGPPHLSRGSGKPACYTAVEAAQSSCGEMSERLKEHAWKLSGLGATDSYRRRPTRAIRATYHQRCSLGSTPYHPVFLDCQPRLRHNPRHNPPATRRRSLAGADSPQSPGADAAPPPEARCDGGATDGAAARPVLPVVRDGDAMGVAPDVVDHLRGIAEGGLGVDDPVLRPRGPEMVCRQSAEDRTAL